MKKIYFALGILVISGLPLILQTGCGSTPASPAAATATPTPTVEIVWAYPSIYHYLGGQNAFVYVRVNSQPVTTAGVTLSGTFTGAPVALPQTGFVTFGSTVFATYSSASYNYEANKVYTLSTTSMGKTATSSVTSPGNITVLTDSNGAVTQASWAYEGNADTVEVYENSPTSQSTFYTYPALSDAVSPVAIPDSGGSNAYPDGSGSSYTTTTTVENITTAIANGSITQSGEFYAKDYLISNVTLP